MKNLPVVALSFAVMLLLEQCSGSLEKKSPELCRTRYPLSFNPQPGEPDKLSSFIPHDVDFVQLQNGYSTLNEECQPTFDYFSWQSFVALNWPANQDGSPMDSLNASSSAPRVWEFFTDPNEVFIPGYSKKLRLRARSAVDVLTMTFKSDIPNDTLSDDIEAGTSSPLIDRNLNFVLYEVRVNDEWVSYVKSKNLDTKKGQQQFADSGNQVQFIQGYYADTVTNSGGTVGAIEIKASWRIIDTTRGDDPSRYYTKQAVIYVDSAKSATGKAFTINATVGLVGLHINHYTETRGGDGIWTTFEHVDNAPSSTGSVGDTTRYSFYNQQCADCPVNTPPTLPGTQKNFLWASQPPYAAQYATNGKYGTQVVRADTIFGPTEQINALWRAKLKGTVWEHYKLIGSQWLNAENSRPGNIIGIPEKLSNTTLETYVQGQQMGSCMTCHGFATGAVSSLHADFSFLLGHAK